MPDVRWHRSLYWRVGLGVVGLLLALILAQSAIFLLVGSRFANRITPEEGGRLAGGGDKVAADTQGYFMQPTVIADTTPEMRINNEEVFGPVVSTVRVKNYDEALALANAGNFGLSSGIVTQSLAKARHFRKNVKAGMVMVNLPTAGVDYHVPFGGTRGSSYGPREQGFAAVEFYTQVKTVYTGD